MISPSSPTSAVSETEPSERIPGFAIALLRNVSVGWWWRAIAEHSMDVLTVEVLAKRLVVRGAHWIASLHKTGSACLAHDGVRVRLRCP